MAKKKNDSELLADDADNGKARTRVSPTYVLVGDDTDGEERTEIMRFTGLGEARGGLRVVNEFLSERFTNLTWQILSAKTVEV